MTRPLPERYTFKEAVLKLAPGNDMHKKFRDVVDALIEQGTVADDDALMQGGFGGGGFGGFRGGSDRDMHTEMRDRLIRDLEELCPKILQPSEISKMRAVKSLVYAREAIDLYGDRSRMLMHVREGKEMYDRVSQHLDANDVMKMCEGFMALDEHLSALQVLLKRCMEKASSEKDGIEENEANQLHDVVVTISRLPDRSILTRALQQCLEHRGLYMCKVKKQVAAVNSVLQAQPAIDYVLKAVIASADYMSLWPVLRKVDILKSPRASKFTTENDVIKYDQFTTYKTS